MTNTAIDSGQEKESSFDLGLLLKQYLAYWYWVIPCLCITVGAAYLYLRYTTPTYLVNAALLIKERRSSTGDYIMERQGDDPRGTQIENEVEVLKSRGLMLRVIDALNLTVRYYKKGFFARDEEIYDASPIWIYTGKLTPKAYQGPVYVNILNKRQYELQDEEGNSKGRYLFNQDSKSEYGSFRVLLKDVAYKSDYSLVKVTFETREQSAQRYQALFRVASSLASAVLKLYLEEAVPDRGKVFVDKVLEIYTQLALEDKNMATKYALRFIDERLKVASAELNAVEQNVESYKNTRGVTDLNSQASKYLETVSATDGKLNEIDLNLQLLANVDNYLKNSASGSAPALMTVNDPLLSDQLQKLGGLQSQYEKYSQTMQAGNPFLQGVIAQIESTKKDIQENIDNQRKNYESSRKNFEQFNQRSESSIRSIPQQERQLVNIQRQQAVKQDVYTLLLRKKEDIEVTAASAVTDSRIIDYASSTSAPLRPSKANAYLVAFVLGLLIPIGGVTLKLRLNTKVKSRNEIENETGLAVFAEIMSKPQLKSGTTSIKSLEADRIIAEQFRTLRANLPYAAMNSLAPDSQIILVTSSISGEGKSYFSSNLASALAQVGNRVVLLDADMRKLKTDETETVPGLSDYLSGQCEIRNLLGTANPTNVHRISSGSLPDNPAELLSSRRLGLLFTSLRQKFDYIIVDTPPVAVLADTTLLAPHTDKVFYLVRHEFTPRSCLQLLTSASINKKFKALNLIYNGVSYEQNQEAAYRIDYKLN